MQTGTAHTVARDNQYLSTGSATGSGNEHLDRNAPEIGRFASNSEPRINEIFGNNITLQRNTFMVVGIATLVVLPTLAWVRYLIGDYHPLTTTIVVVAMLSCLPAVFSSVYPRMERFAGHLLIAVLTSSLIAFIALNGGLGAPILAASPLLPIMAAFLLGPRAGLAMATLIIVGIATVIIYSSYSPPSAAPPLTAAQYGLANGLFIAVISVVAALIGWGFHRRFGQLQAELFFSSTHDPLTGAANRKCLELALFQEAEKRRTTYSVSLLILDIDYFKRFNDNHGHQAGDLVLKTVVNIALAVAKRSNDVVARYGGDEFVVVLPNTSHNAAMEVAERLRCNVAQQRLQLSLPGSNRSDTTLSSGNSTLGDDDIVTLSIGVATHPAGRYNSPNDFADNLMARADSAMYRAKQAGGNRVVASANAANSVNG